MKKEYDKLIRDKIPSIIQSQGKDVEIVFAKYLPDNQYYEYRRKKVLEEVEELKEALSKDEVNSDDVEEELADVLETMSYFMFGEELSETYMKTLYTKAKEKCEKKGAFDQGYILKSVSETETANNQTAVTFIDPITLQEKVKCTRCGNLCPGTADNYQCECGWGSYTSKAHGENVVKDKYAVYCEWDYCPNAWSDTIDKCEIYHPTKEALEQIPFDCVGHSGNNGMSFKVYDTLEEAILESGYNPDAIIFTLFEDEVNLKNDILSKYEWSHDNGYVLKENSSKC